MYNKIEHNLSMCDTVKNQLEKDTKFQKKLFQKPACKMTSWFIIDSSKCSFDRFNLNCSNSSTEST